MPKRTTFINGHDIVFGDLMQYTGAATGNGMLGAGMLDIPAGVRKSLLTGGKIYNNLVNSVWPLYPNQSGGLLFMRTPTKRVDCILFFAVDPSKGSFTPGQYAFDGTVEHVHRVYWTRKRLAGLRTRIKIPGLVKKSFLAGLGTPEPNRVTREDYMVTDAATGKSRLACVNFFDDEVSSLEDLIVDSQVEGIKAGLAGGDYWVG